MEKTNNSTNISLFDDISDLDLLKLTKFQTFLYKIIHFFKAIPKFFVDLFGYIINFIKGFFVWLKDDITDIFKTFKEGDFKTKLSFLIMGFGSITRGQYLRGLLFLLFEIVFFVYMFTAGFHWLGKLPTLGTQAPGMAYDPKLDTYVRVEGDDSFKCLLYGVLTILFILAFIYTWRLNVKQNQISEMLIKEGKKLKSTKDDMASLLDEDFHKTLLALPLLGIFFFTVLPIIFMILVAFTNYDGAHDGYSNLFTWVGLDNFNSLLNLNLGANNLSVAFGEILSWTIIWAIFATFTNYFLGMFVAIMINKKGIKFKKLWRGILVLTSAVPQFISLLYVSKMFAANGLVNGMLLNAGIISDLSHIIRFWEDSTLARIMVIVINIWVGVPYLMLIVTGILMNIPADLYESARIDGANAVQQFFKITLPYMLFVTGPYLLTSFIGNINNFNVIYLLTAGGPDNPKLLTSAGSAGDTDLLITWLFKITTGAESKYYLASVIGIMIFVFVSFLALVVYNAIPSTRNEEDYS